MNKLLGKSRVVLAVTLALPFVLLAAARLAAWVELEGGGELAFLLLLLCILSVYVSLVAGVLALGCGLFFRLLGVVDLRRGVLLSLVALACANAVASVVWIRVFVRHLNFRY
jgi:hypothetical protein